MTLEELMRLKSPELTIIETEIKNPGETGKPLTINQDFSIDFSKNALSTGRIILPVLRPSILKKRELTFRKKMYTKYANYLDYEIKYRRGNLMRIDIKPGFRVFKSEEKYFDQLFRDQDNISLFFRYNHQKKIWSEVGKRYDQLWKNQHLEIEKALSDPDWIQIEDEFLNWMQTDIEPQAQQPYVESLERFNQLLKSIKTYYDVKNKCSEISDEHYKLIQNKIFELGSQGNQLLAYIQKHQLHAPPTYDIPSGDPNTKFLEDLRTFQFNIEGLMQRPAYWVQNNRIYPNPAEDIAQDQAATTHRNPETKRILGAALLSLADGYYELNSVAVKNAISQQENNKNK